MNHSETFTKIAAALVKAGAEMPSVTKNATNPAFRSKFANLDGIIDTVKPVLARHELTVFQSVGDSPAGIVRVETTILHTSGEWIMASVPVPIGKNDAQGVGSAITYGRRYSLAAALSLATDEDDDANAAVKTTKAKETRPVAATVAGAPVAALAGLTTRTDDPTVMPTGDFAGQPLTEVPTPELKALVTYLKGKDAVKYKQLITNANDVLNDRVLGTKKVKTEPQPAPTDTQRVERMKAGVAADGESLPFP